LANLRKKHNDAVAEMAEQVDQLNKLKTKWVFFRPEISFSKIHKFIVKLSGAKLKIFHSNRPDTQCLFQWFRAEHDRANMYNELNNTRAACDSLSREKVKWMWSCSSSECFPFFVFENLRAIKLFSHVGQRRCLRHERNPSS
jgi:hypothetical protein